MRRKFGREEIIPPLAFLTAEELPLAFQRVWGDDITWTDFNGWDTCGPIITRTALTVMIGNPLCRDESLLEMTRLFANALMMAAGFTNCLPPFMRPLAGPLFAVQARYYQARCRRMLIPLVEKRVQMWRDCKEGEDLPVCFASLSVSHAHSSTPDHANAIAGGLPSVAYCQVCRYW